MRTAQGNFYKKIFGGAGENRAVKFLKSKGYKILERNYKTRLGEADVIAKDGETLVFIEVKTRKTEYYGAPAEAVTREKRRKYCLVAEEYLMRNKLSDVFCRFDVIEVEEDKINHIENAFFT